MFLLEEESGSFRNVICYKFFLCNEIPWKSSVSVMDNVCLYLLEKLERTWIKLGVFP